MIEHARSGTHILGKSFLLLKDIKMSFIPLLSIILLGMPQYLVLFLICYRDKIVTGSFDKTAKVRKIGVAFSTYIILDLGC